MSVLWIDAWVQATTRGEAKTILIDTYIESTSVLRWYLEGTGHQIFVQLVLFPNGVRQTRPLPRFFASPP